MYTDIINGLTVPIHNGRPIKSGETGAEYVAHQETNTQQVIRLSDKKTLSDIITDLISKSAEKIAHSAYDVDSFMITEYNSIKDSGILIRSEVSNIFQDRLTDTSSFTLTGETPPAFDNTSNALSVGDYISTYSTIDLLSFMSLGSTPKLLYFSVLIKPNTGYIFTTKLVQVIGGVELPIIESNIEDFQNDLKIAKFTFAISQQCTHLYLTISQKLCNMYGCVYYIGRDGG